MAVAVGNLENQTSSSHLRKPVLSRYVLCFHPGQLFYSLLMLIGNLPNCLKPPRRKELLESNTIIELDGHNEFTFPRCRDTCDGHVMHYHSPRNSQVLHRYILILEYNIELGVCVAGSLTRELL